MKHEKIETVYTSSNMTQDLNIISLLFDKYGLRTVTDFAKENNLTRQAVYKRIENGKQMYIELNGIKFIIND